MEAPLRIFRTYAQHLTFQKEFHFFGDENVWVCPEYNQSMSLFIYVCKFVPCYPKKRTLLSFTKLLSILFPN